MRRLRIAEQVAESAFNHVTIRNDAVPVDEETAAAREFLALRIEGLNRDGGGFDAPDEIGKFILRAAFRGDCGNESTRE